MSVSAGIITSIGQGGRWGWANTPEMVGKLKELVKELKTPREIPEAGVAAVFEDFSSGIEYSQVKETHGGDITSKWESWMRDHVEPAAVAVLGQCEVIRAMHLVMLKANGIKP